VYLCIFFIKKYYIRDEQHVQRRSIQAGIYSFVIYILWLR